MVDKLITGLDADEAKRDATHKGTPAGLVVVPQPTKPKRIRSEKVATPAETPVPKAEVKAKLKLARKVKPAKEKAAPKDRGNPAYAVFGKPVTAVIRALGKAGFSFKETTAALEGLSVKPSPNTVRIFLSAGKSGQRGAPAELTGEQLGELKTIATARLANATPAAAVTAAA